MNKVILIGRLTKDPELVTTQSDVKKASFTLAVDRRYHDANGNRQADFLPCVAWRGTAEFIAKHFTKGKKICVTGSVQTRSYDAQDGTKRHVTEINVEEAEFVEPAQRPDGQAGELVPAQPAQLTQPVQQMIEEDDDELPF